MRLCFMCYGTSHEIAKVMIASVREHMPNLVVTQLTDMRSPKVPGVDEVRRMDGKTYPYILYKHMADVPEPFIRVDYDMIFQGDITHVMEGDHDLAFNLHSDPKVLATWGKDYPFATCVWAAKSRCKEFTEDFRQIHMASGRDAWMGLIPSVNEAIQTGKYRIRTLPGSVYNYTPKDRNDRPKDALVIHYKGHRKRWMLPEDQEHLVYGDIARLKREIRPLDKNP